MSQKLELLAVQVGGGSVLPVKDSPANGAGKDGGQGCCLLQSRSFWEWAGRSSTLVAVQGHEPHGQRSGQEAS